MTRRRQNGTAMSHTDPAPATAGDRTPAPSAAASAVPLTADLVPFGEAVRTWFAISLQTFGGPAGQIAVMQRGWWRRSAGSASGGFCTL